jgi:16S rRNA C1402 N4-methylase RsmH
MSKKAEERLSEYNNATIINDSYANIDKIVEPGSVDFVLLDLGVNMEHFKDAER